MEKLVTADPAKVLSSRPEGTTTVPAAEETGDDFDMENGEDAADVFGPPPTLTMAEEAEAETATTTQEETPIATASAENAQEEDAAEAVNVNMDGSVNINTAGMKGLSSTVSNPPDTEDDLMSSQSQAVNTAVPLNSKGNTQKGGGTGGGTGGGRQRGIGSLFSDMVAFVESNAGATRHTRRHAKKLRARVTTRRR